MEKRVLFIDNDCDFLKARSEHLERAGYMVLKAISADEAEQVLADRWIHLMIVDIRLRDDNDDRDVTGLILAKDKRYESIPKIILTRYANFEYVREALGPRPNGQPPAVNFLDKTEGAQATIQAVDTAFQTHVKINDELTIRWGPLLSAHHMATRLNPRVTGSAVDERAKELTDLFGRLFDGRRQVTLNRIFYQTAGQLALSISAFSAEGLEEPFLVVCGLRSVIEQAKANYHRFVSQAPQVGSTIQAGSATTTHYGLIAFKLIGADLEAVSTFKEFYALNASDRVEQVIENLFTQTLAGQHRQRIPTPGQSIKSFFLPEAFLTDKSFLQNQLHDHLADLRQYGLSANRSHSDRLPTDLMAYLLSDETESNLTTTWGITQGQLKVDTILVDRQGCCWLTDFSQVGPGPRLRDFIELEMSIKLDLLSGFDLQAGQRLAQADLIPEQPISETAALSPEIQKAVQVIEVIRRLAGTAVSTEADGYRHGLLLKAIAQLADYQPQFDYTHRERLPYLYCLMSAALLSQHLAPEPPADLPDQAKDSLWINEERKEVWITGQSIKLAPGEYRLLLYLYHNADQVCTFIDISENVFETQFPSDLTDRDKKQIDEARRHAAIGRLRREIEPNPRQPKFIETIRGDGYRLNLRFH